MSNNAASEIYEMEDDIDDITYQKISEFLTKKRWTIVSILYLYGEMLQKELAEKAGTTVTALSNMLLRFDGFSPPLLSITYKGRCCYISLSQVGREYFKRSLREEQKNNEKAILSHEGARLFQEAQDCLKQFQSLYEDEWELKFDDLISGFIRVDQVTDLQGEKLVNNFIHCLERLQFGEYGNFSLRVIELLESKLLRKRLEQFAEEYEVTYKVTEALANPENVFAIYQVLHSIVTDEEADPDTVEHLQWKEYYVPLRNILHKAVSRLAEWGQENIFFCMGRYFQGQEQLCAFLANDIFNNKGNLRIKYD